MRFSRCTSAGSTFGSTPWRPRRCPSPTVAHRRGGRPSRGSSRAGGSDSSISRRARTHGLGAGKRKTEAGVLEPSPEVLGGLELDRLKAGSAGGLDVRGGIVGERGDSRGRGERGEETV